MKNELLLKDKIADLLFHKKYLELVVYKQIRLDDAIAFIEKQERIEIGKYLEHCHLSHYETHRLISIHDIERLKSGQALKGDK